MPTTSVTGFTKARMDDLDNSTIVDGSVVGSDLILQRRDGATINAGNVKGPTGPVGVVSTGARGIMAYAQRTTQQSGITTTPTEITGLNVTFTAVAGRRYRLSVYCLMIGGTNDVAQIRITNSTGATVYQSAQASMVSPFNVSMRAEVTLVPGAGSKTYKLYVVRTSGSSPLTFDCHPYYPAYLMAEDIGLS